jgi:hypothetical protein
MAHQNAEPRIINCHTHIFTAAHVPPFLAKTYVPWPFYYLIHLRFIVAIFRWWYKGPATIKHAPWFKQLVKTKTYIQAFFDRRYPLTIPLGYYLFFLSFFQLYELLPRVYEADETWLSKNFANLHQFAAPIFPDITAKWLKILIIVLVFFFFESIRNWIWMFAKLIWKFLGKLPGPQTKEMFERYLNIGRYAFHKEQKTILSKLKDQYPKGTGFVVLPMDLDYMNAGQSPTRYRDQMKKLAEVKAMPSNKNILFPFVFADPRRMVKVETEINYKKGDKPYFEWHIDTDGKVVLEDCFMKDYLEEHKFSGIKIYPALGYYPFDEKLLPLWKYCADNGIPILTHCIRGTIYYRGVKQQDWNFHPVFEQSMEKIETEDVREVDDGFEDDEDREKEKLTRYEKLVLPQAKNVDLSYNFTHPLNYICLLENELLYKVIKNAVDSKSNKNEEHKAHTDKLVKLFGYDPSKPGVLSANLRKLKICFGHFGGEDEWKRYFEKDRYNYSSQLTKNPKTGIRFLKTINGNPAPGKLEQLWKFTDWYSIICSMMLQYPCIYADISYILHGSESILPLLKQTLEHSELNKRVLYGTDFFVVRNHKSDKNILADMMGGLSKNEFNLIARHNPIEYLKHSPCVDPESPNEVNIQVDIT